MAIEKKSIKSLTQLIKERNKRESENTTTQKSPTDPTPMIHSIRDHRENNRTVDTENLSDTTKFLDFINKVNKMDQYGADSIVYIDQDIHEIFTKLKYASKIKISHLASFLLENFIKENIEAISEIINKKSNKFL